MGEFLNNQLNRITGRAIVLPQDVDSSKGVTLSEAASSRRSRDNRLASALMQQTDMEISMKPGRHRRIPVAKLRESSQ